MIANNINLTREEMDHLCWLVAQAIAGTSMDPNRNIAALVDKGRLTPTIHTKVHNPLMPITPNPTDNTDQELLTPDDEKNLSDDSPDITLNTVTESQPLTMAEQAQLEERKRNERLQKESDPANGNQHVTD